MLRREADISQTGQRELEDGPVSLHVRLVEKCLPLMDPSFLLHQREPRPAEEIKYGIITAIML